MASDDKKRTYNLEIYKKKLREAKDVYKKRKEFIASFRLPKTEEEEEEANAETGNGNAVGDQGLGNEGSAAAATYYLNNFRVSTPFAPDGIQDGVHKNGHRGIDLASKDGKSILGKPIVSLTDGTVVEVLINSSDAGNGARIKAPNGYLYSYIHMQEAPMVKVGDTVTANQQIGKIGSTGHSTGPHLDLKVKNEKNEYIDPYALLQELAKGSSSNTSGGGGDDGKGLIALAKTKMKAPYVFGAAGPNTFDCSGFVCWVYNQKGYKFGRSTAAGYYSMFQATSNPKPGDLIFFSNTYKPGVSHIGIWMGGNEFIHTANKRNGVQISQLTGYYKNKFTGFRTIQSSYYKGGGSSKSLAVKTRAESFAALDSVGEVGDSETYPPIEEEGSYESKNKVVYSYNPVRFIGNSIRQSNDTREVFLHNRVGWARSINYEQFESLNKELFIHQEHYDGHEGNLYSPDAKKLFENLLLKTKKPYFEVISGFRFSNQGQISPHEAGCAIDILVREIDEVREIADCAWMLGVRSIGIGGDFEQKKGFIHLDIAPKGDDFMYDGIPIYGGPGKWVSQ